MQEQVVSPAGLPLVAMRLARDLGPNEYRAMTHDDTWHTLIVCPDCWHPSVHPLKHLQRTHRWAEHRARAYCRRAMVFVGVADGAATEALKLAKQYAGVE